ncbi:phage protease [Dinoroseobacter sp. PD6]|uniref:phage protease n=1 Tax=Dinoroseobacter sp. PD6 TaxID=3028384 RepID=UPI00237A6BB9|nr:phage protease [Dinoroseobacter sp. PD6]MDD9716773.1 phage protease [Dinoroseobacter sp. PD6]
MVALFHQGGIDLPIDYEHQGDDPARQKNGPVPAAGWIKRLEVRPDGIWGDVSWTAKAREMLEAREYRFLSPVLMHTKTGGRITRLKGASLVHRPNLDLTALASEGDDMTDPEDTSALAAIAEALELEPVADADAIMAAIAELRSKAETAEPDPAKYVPIAALKELMQDRGATKATLSEHLVEARVTEALHAGYITPAMRSWATALCAQDPDSFEDFIASTTPAYGHLFKRAAIPGLAADASAPPETVVQSLCDQLGLKPSDFEVR